MLPTLVLTAGLGTRLDPLTRLVAKPAVPVAGRTLGERVLRWLAREGVTDTVLNLHALPHTITGTIGDGAHLGLRVRYSWEREVLGSAGGPRHALPLFSASAGDEAAPLLIVNGDTLTDIALAPVVDAFRRSGAEVLMVVIPNPAPDRYNGILAGDDGVVRGFIPKGHRESSWHFVGIQVVRRSVFAALADNTPAETVRELYRDMVATTPGRVCVFPVDAVFHDVGTPADYLAMCGEFGGADATGTVIWPDATVAAGASLSACIVAGPVTVPAHVVASRSVIVPRAVARPTDRCNFVGDAAVFPF